MCRILHCTGQLDKKNANASSVWILAGIVRIYFKSRDLVFDASCCGERSETYQQNLEFIYTLGIIFRIMLLNVWSVVLVSFCHSELSSWSSAEVAFYNKLF